jgi:hypothetical protein
MQELIDEYVDFPNSQQLKELGFDHSCYTTYIKGKLMNPFSIFIEETAGELFKDSVGFVKNSQLPEGIVAAPQINQVVRFFERNYIFIERKTTVDNYFIYMIKQGKVMTDFVVVGRYNICYNKAIKYCIELLKAIKNG